MSQQQLQTVVKDLEETQHHCEALTQQLDAVRLQIKEKVKSNICFFFLQNIILFYKLTAVACSLKTKYLS